MFQKIIDRFRPFPIGTIVIRRLTGEIGVVVHHWNDSWFEVRWGSLCSSYQQKNRLVRRATPSEILRHKLTGCVDFVADYKVTG